MKDTMVLNVTNIVLGLATLALWGIIVTGLVQEYIDRKKRRNARNQRAQIHLVSPRKVA